MKVVNREETEEEVTDQPHPLLVTTFLSHGRERRALMSGAIDTGCAPTLAGTRWFEKFEVEPTNYGTPVEVVHDNETFRLQQSRRVLVQLFSWLPWDRTCSF